ncbi:hypothetical protein XENTR_v10009780 [Xenopus tropicalis]|uniref:Olfactory receptor n=1 Tax=Xenopus tropicalis TaxID=8364 RepID=A0A8J0R2I5_XENTR|nr:olfactory receptor 1019 [Xenopus tropicalis]KAE8619447.1 hypothetical protein XENTR_v10009780 [Xenopus tropicalis]|eukprot:XP_004913135.1 PREDICTED: olfactory receptor 1019-like [Xenopus tropicalis]
MQTPNQSLDIVFLFDGLTKDPRLDVVLFIIFLVIYIFTILGNGGLIVLVMKSPSLHTPMYFFLKHLSFIDMCYTSVIIPRSLSDFLSNEKTITLLACAVQMYLYAAYFNAEVLLLAAMAYDRYAAICKPLLYHVLMKRRVCHVLICACYSVGFFDSFIHTRNVFSQSYCNSLVISNFFCDVAPVLKLSCSDTSMTELVLYAVVGINSFVCLATIVTSYAYIFSTILRIQSAQGRLKAFTTCSSHLVSVGTLFGTLMYMYLRPNSSYSNDQDKVVSVFYTMVIPMLNPIIYSFRNKDVRRAFLKLTF